MRLTLTNFLFRVYYSQTELAHWTVDAMAQIYVPLKVIFKRKNLCDGFLKDCLNFADNSIYFWIGKESVSISIGKAECLE